MNDMPTEVDSRGVMLTDNVDMEWLKTVTPRYYDEYIKFVVNVDTNRVHIGMDIHADCVGPGEDPAPYYGGNIFFEDGHIEYESTLNIQKNMELGDFAGNPRVIRNADMIERMNAVLFAWVSGLEGDA